MFRSSLLDETHLVDEFESGAPELDAWLRAHARDAEAKRTARTYVWVDDTERVVGYYSLVAHKLSRAGLPPKLGRGDPSEVPAVLIAKLALRKDLHGQRLGAALLGDAFNRILAASRLVGVRYVVVDAIDDDAIDFYVHHGFVPVPGLEPRLVRKVSDVARDRPA